VYLGLNELNGVHFGVVFIVHVDFGRGNEPDNSPHKDLFVLDVELVVHLRTCLRKQRVKALNREKIRVAREDIEAHA